MFEKMGLSKFSIIKHWEWSKDDRNTSFIENKKSHSDKYYLTIRGTKIKTTIRQIPFHFSENGVYLEKTFMLFTFI